MQQFFERMPLRPPVRQHRAEQKISPLDAAYSQALEVLSQDAISPDAFTSLYGVPAIENDRRYVERKKTAFAREETPESREAKKLATVFEAIIHEQAELGEWLGPDAHTVKPWEYDDIAHGVDTIVEFRERERAASHLALAIDVTFGHHAREKLQDIKNGIDEGKLTRIKYFQSTRTSPPEELPSVPRVVIGAERGRVQELIDLWMAGDKKRLAAHPIQLQILGEMRMQLRTFEEYARRVGQQGVSATYHRSAEVIERILSAKQGLQAGRAAAGAVGRDKIFEEMNRYLVHEFKPSWFAAEPQGGK